VVKTNFGKVSALVDEVHVIILEPTDVHLLCTLAIQVKLLKALQPGEHPPVIVVQQVLVRVMAMQGIEGVIAHDELALGTKQAAVGRTPQSVQTSTLGRRSLDAGASTTGVQAGDAGL
jgi:hypothetical protein